MSIYLFMRPQRFCFVIFFLIILLIIASCEKEEEQQTNATQLCGDGTCDEKEQTSGLCSQDCDTSSPETVSVSSDSSTTDIIATTCSETDQFAFTDIGVAIDAEMMGVEEGGSIADSTAVVLPDGRVRIYFQYVSKDKSTGVHYSAISEDGITFTMEKGTVFGKNEMSSEWWGPHIKAKVLDDGQLRIYKGATPREEENTGIISYISSDWVTFTKENGFRITSDDANLEKLSHLTIVSTDDGTYRGYFSNMPQGSDSTRLVKSATSADLLTWTMDSGVRVGIGASPAVAAEYSAEQPHALQRKDGCVTLFYYSTHYQDGTLRPPQLRYSTSSDGLTFDTLYSLELNGNGPDIITLPDGTYLLYYDKAGYIGVGKLKLTSS